jgi:hypothetical protein
MYIYGKRHGKKIKKLSFYFLENHAERVRPGSGQGSILIILSLDLGGLLVHYVRYNGSFGLER